MKNSSEKFCTYWVDIFRLPDPSASAAACSVSWSSCLPSLECTVLICTAPSSSPSFSHCVYPHRRPIKCCHLQPSSCGGGLLSRVGIQAGELSRLQTDPAVALPSGTSQFAVLRGQKLSTRHQVCVRDLWRHLS